MTRGGSKGAATDTTTTIFSWFLGDVEFGKLDLNEMTPWIRKLVAKYSVPPIHHTNIKKNPTLTLFHPRVANGLKGVVNDCEK